MATEHGNKILLSYLTSGIKSQNWVTKTSFLIARSKFENLEFPGFKSLMHLDFIDMKMASSL